MFRLEAIKLQPICTCVFILTAIKLLLAAMLTVCFVFYSRRFYLIPVSELATHVTCIGSSGSSLFSFALNDISICVLWQMLLFNVICSGLFINVFAGI